MGKGKRKRIAGSRGKGTPSVKETKNEEKREKG